MIQILSLPADTSCIYMYDATWLFIYLYIFFVWQGKKTCLLLLSMTNSLSVSFTNIHLVSLPMILIQMCSLKIFSLLPAVTNCKIKWHFSVSKTNADTVSEAFAVNKNDFILYFCFPSKKRSSPGSKSSSRTCQFRDIVCESDCGCSFLLIQRVKPLRQH